MDSKTFELVEIKNAADRWQSGLFRLGWLIPHGGIMVDLEGHLRSDVFSGGGVVVAIIDVKPTIDKRIIIVSAMEGIRRIGLTTRIRGAIWDGIPGFVGANKVDGFNLGAIPFICRGVSERKETEDGVNIGLRRKKGRRTYMRLWELCCR